MEKSLLSMIQPTSPRKSAKVNVSKDSNAYGRQAGNVNEWKKVGISGKREG